MRYDATADFLKNKTVCVWANGQSLSARCFAFDTDAKVAWCYVLDAEGRKIPNGIDEDLQITYKTEEVRGDIEYLIVGPADDRIFQGFGI